MKELPCLKSIGSSLVEPGGSLVLYTHLQRLRRLLLLLVLDFHEEILPGRHASRTSFNFHGLRHGVSWITNWLLLGCLGLRLYSRGLRALELVLSSRRRGVREDDSGPTRQTRGAMLERPSLSHPERELLYTCLSCGHTSRLEYISGRVWISKDALELLESILCDFWVLFSYRLRQLAVFEINIFFLRSTLI